MHNIILYSYNWETCNAMRPLTLKYWPDVKLYNRFVKFGSGLKEVLPDVKINLATYITHSTHSCSNVDGMHILWMQQLRFTLSKDWDKIGGHLFISFRSFYLYLYGILIGKMSGISDAAVFSLLPSAPKSSLSLSVLLRHSAVERVLNSSYYYN